MGKVNVCLKYVFLIFNALFHVLGWMSIFGAVRSASAGASGIENPVVTWLVIIGVISISGLGLYGGRSESALPLKIFAGCVGVGLILMLIFAIIGITQRRQIQDAIHSGSIHVTKEQAELLDQIYQIAIGMYFGLSAVAGLSLGMSISMIRQIQRYDSRGPVTFSA